MDEKTKTVAIYESTHYKLSVMAAIKKVSIKKFLQELVEREKLKQKVLKEIPVSEHSDND